MVDGQAGPNTLKSIKQGKNDHNKETEDEATYLNEKELKYFVG